jgi:hypothetical protein
MWPTLEVGSIYQILIRGRRKVQTGMLLRVLPDGELLLARPPQSRRGKWAPLAVDRHEIKGVWSRA